MLGIVGVTSIVKLVPDDELCVGAGFLIGLEMSPRLLFRTVGENLLSRTSIVELIINVKVWLLQNWIRESRFSALEAFLLDWRSWPSPLVLERASQTKRSRKQLGTHLYVAHIHCSPPPNWNQSRSAMALIAS